VLDTAFGAVAAELLANALFYATDCSLTALLQPIHTGMSP
jgi:hypothetical protein